MSTFRYAILKLHYISLGITFLLALLVLDACYLFLLAATVKTALVAWFWAGTQLISIWQGADMCGV